MKRLAKGFFNDLSVSMTDSKNVIADDDLPMTVSQEAIERKRKIEVYLADELPTTRKEEK